MTKYEVVDIIAKEHLVDRIVNKLLSSSRNPFDCPEDLIQDIYLLLLQKDDNLIVNLYNKEEIGFYLLKISRNQLLSKNSPYYTKYIKFRANSDDLTQAANTIFEEDRRRVC